MAIYYVSNVPGSLGSDLNDGLSVGSPWLTVAKVNTSTFSPGDRIRFERGGDWKEKLYPPNSGSALNHIVFEAYGTGAPPRFNGYTTITGWVDEGGGMHSKIDASWQTSMRMVTIDNQTQPKGRFPKTDKLVISGGSGSTSGTVVTADSRLNNTPNYNGGEVVIQKRTWIEDTCFITSHTNKTIGFSGGNATYDVGSSNGWGFFIQNHPNCCTEFGDWWYDGGSKKLYMYFGAEDPADYEVKAVGEISLVNVVAKNYLKFEGLHIDGAHQNGFHFENCNNNEVNLCMITKIGQVGVFMSTSGDADNIKVNYNVIRDTYNFAIRAEGSRFIDVIGNDIQYNYQYAGTSANGDNNASAIGLGTFGFRNGNYNVNNNYIRDVGYNGIYVSGANVLIEKNEITRTCLNKEDGAGIYLFGARQGVDLVYYTNRIIRNNYIYGNVPNTNPTPYGSREVFGIYFDDRSRNFECHSNYIGENYVGLYIHNSRDYTAHSNVLFKNSYYQLQFGDDNASGASDADGNIQGMNMYNNVLYALGSSKLIYINNDESSIADFGTINNNWYIKPDGGTIIDKYFNYGSLQSYSTVAAWTAAHGYDAGTGSSPTTSTVAKVYLNNTDVSVSTPIGSDRIDVNGDPYSSPQLIPSFGNVFVMEGTDPVIGGFPKKIKIGGVLIDAVYKTKIGGVVTPVNPKVKVGLVFG